MHQILNQVSNTLEAAAVTKQLNTELQELQDPSLMELHHQPIWLPLQSLTELETFQAMELEAAVESATEHQELQEVLKYLADQDSSLVKLPPHMEQDQDQDQSLDQDLDSNLQLKEQATPLDTNHISANMPREETEQTH